MLSLQKKLTNTFYVILGLPSTAMGFALSIQIAVLSWILRTKYNLESDQIGIVWAAGLDVNGIPDGPHTLRVTATSPDGDGEPASRSLTVTLAPPALAALLPARLARATAPAAERAPTMRGAARRRG